MNKVKVIREFIDLENDSVLRLVGDILEVTDKRLVVLSGDNIHKKVYVEAVEEPKEKTVAELKAELDAKGIEYDAKAKKAELIDLLGE